MLKYGIFLVLVAAGAYCDVLSEAGDFFTKQFTDFKSLFATDQTQLQQNVGRVKDLLSTVQDKMSLLRPLASDAQKSTLDKVSDMVSQVTNFEKTMSDAAVDFNQKKEGWEQIVKNIFVTDGLNSILPLLQKIQNGATITSATALLTCIIPILTIALRD